MEIKNKYNTIKGNHKVAIYDDIDLILKDKYIGYTGYYVAIIDKKRINLSFTPPDNKTKTRRKENQYIRQVGGKTFYTIATGNENAIEMIYQIVPKIISDIIGASDTNISKSSLFTEFFEKSFK
ncbi:hypothetical protein CAXC1_220066 [Candidatus Xenohaliotis californiensis]|uniref:Uncharacterized protein n=1 Tax=Candidatus Xenohaliotis californiensis TaxID=84677 RepID=A0ABM9N7W1_9RICK|nr:hypothetical protein CAXC1_220066 [Candidatus Xenohaliotis californiensis]